MTYCLQRLVHNYDMDIDGVDVEIVLGIGELEEFTLL